MPSGFFLHLLIHRLAGIVLFLSFALIFLVLIPLKFKMLVLKGIGINDEEIKKLITKFTLAAYFIYAVFINLIIPFFPNYSYHHIMLLSLTLFMLLLEGIFYKIKLKDALKHPFMLSLALNASFYTLTGVFLCLP